MCKHDPQYATYATCPLCYLEASWQSSPLCHACPAKDAELARLRAEVNRLKIAHERTKEQNARIRARLGWNKDIYLGERIKEYDELRHVAMRCEDVGGISGVLRMCAENFQVRHDYEEQARAVIGFLRESHTK